MLDDRCTHVRRSPSVVFENGWYVGYRVVASERGVTIWMKYWEFGESEPDFPSEATA